MTIALDQSSLREPAGLLHDTRVRLLDAAELLFAAQDYDSTSLREITELAKVNLAAVNYHFGTKKELYRAVLRRRFQPINQLRLEQLDAAEKTAAGQPVSLRRVLDIFLRPIFTMKTQGGDAPHPFVRLMNRHLSAPHPDMAEVLENELAEIRIRFSTAMQHILPELPAPVLGRRWRLVIGGTLHVFARLHTPFAKENLPSSPEETEAAFQDVLTFFEAGLRSPTTVEQFSSLSP